VPASATWRRSLRAAHQRLGAAAPRVNQPTNQTQRRPCLPPLRPPSVPVAFGRTPRRPPRPARPRLPTNEPCRDVAISRDARARHDASRSRCNERHRLRSLPRTNERDEWAVPRAARRAARGRGPAVVPVSPRAASRVARGAVPREACDGDGFRGGDAKATVDVDVERRGCVGWGGKKQRAFSSAAGPG
jgi:hypothetical protein